MNVEGVSNPEVRKQKTITLIYVAGVVFIVLIILWIVDTSSFNSNVEETQCQVDNVSPDGCNAYKSTLEYETKVNDRKRSYALPVILFLVLIGIGIGMMFLPGYPFSKYLSFKECQQLSSLFPTDNWAWSSNQSNSTDLLCKWFGACRCRSYIQENYCFQYYIQEQGNVPVEYNFDISQKRNSDKNLCSNRSACIVNGIPRFIEQESGTSTTLAPGTCTGISSQGSCSCS